MMIGYARVSTSDQNLDLQRDALRQAGCERIFEDHGVSGTKRVRPGLEQALATVGAGDTLVVWRLDRLGRSLSHLIELVSGFHRDEVYFRSLHEGFDTNSSGGKLFFHLLGALAEFERNLISERTRAGLAAARARGRVGGRRSRVTPEQVSAARGAYAAGSSIEVIAAQWGVSKRTVSRWIDGNPLM